MITKVGKEYRLDIFENFRSDWALPKFRPELTTDQKSAYASSDVMESSTNPSVPTISVSQWRGGVMAMPTIGNMQRETLIRRALKKLKAALGRAAEDVVRTMTPAELFEAVRITMRDLPERKMELFMDRMNAFEKKVDEAAKAGQQARVENMRVIYSLVKNESMLFAVGIRTFITEPQLIEFARKCKRGLRLDWIANFTKEIPEAVRAKKAEADKAKVFDNYVVLHWDPGAKAFGETEADKARKRDPILFGVFGQSRSLYFIGDWIAEDDDLTWDTIVNLVGADGTSRLSDTPSV